MARTPIEPSSALGRQQLLHRRAYSSITLFRVDPDRAAVHRNLFCLFDPESVMSEGFDQGGHRKIRTVLVTDQVELIVGQQLSAVVELDRDRAARGQRGDQFCHGPPEIEGVSQAMVGDYNIRAARHALSSRQDSRASGRQRACHAASTPVRLEHYAGRSQSQTAHHLLSPGGIVLGDRRRHRTSVRVASHTLFPRERR